MKTTYEPGTEAWARDITRPYVSRHFGRTHSPDRCCASVPDGGMSVGFHQCSRRPKVWYGKLGYCRQHDPAAVVRKHKEWIAEYEARQTARHVAREKAERDRNLRECALNAIYQIASGHNDPRGLAQEIIDRHGNIS